MKNSYVLTFENDEQKEKFKLLCFNEKITIGAKLIDLVKKELGSPVIAGLDKEAIKFDRQLEAAKNKERIKEAIKAEKLEAEKKEQEIENKKREVERMEAENKAKEEKRQKDYYYMNINKMIRTPEELEKWNNDNPDKMVIVSAEARKDYQDRKTWEDSLTMSEKLEMYSGKLKYPERLVNEKV
jgi:hypothetical protein